MPTVLIIVLSALAAVTLLSLSRPRRSRLPLPSGPKALPFVGILLQVSQTDVWRYYGTEALQKYGESLNEYIF